MCSLKHLQNCTVSLFHGYINLRKSQEKKCWKRFPISFWKTYHLNNESLSKRSISDNSKPFNTVAAISVLTTLKLGFLALTILFNHLNTRRSRFNHRETRLTAHGFNDPL